LIDGYNLIKRTSGLASKSLEDGRQALVAFIEQQRPQGSTRNQVTVVFDGKPGMYGFPVVGEISVVFTEYETADDLIKYKVEEAHNKKEIVVVTDDKQLLLYVRGLGARVMAVDEFVKKADSRAHGAKIFGRPSQKTKVITSSFEHAVNQEFEKIWITDPDKKKLNEKKPKTK
jgi:predicted RNA-binding protein with PIN domain